MATDGIMPLRLPQQAAAVQPRAAAAPAAAYPPQLPRDQRGVLGHERSGSQCSIG